MKAILLIDMPENCCECDFADTDRICECCKITGTPIENTFVESEDELGRNEDCPLRPMLEKYTDKNVKQIHEYIEDFEMYCLGRNDLIDEILGEDND